MASYDPRECRVCNEVFDEEHRRPRTLSCSHHFCTNCITKLINNQSKQCPFCRVEFQAATAGDVMVNHGVEDFIKYLSHKDSDTTGHHQHHHEHSGTEKIDNAVKDIGASNRNLLVDYQNAETRIEDCIQSLLALKLDLQNENARIEVELLPKINELMSEHKDAIQSLEKTQIKLACQLKEAKDKKRHLRNANEKHDTLSAMNLKEIMSKKDKYSKEHASVESWLELFKNLSPEDDKLIRKTKKVCRSTKEKVSVAIEVFSSKDSSDEDASPVLDNAALTMRELSFSGQLTPQRLQEMSEPVKALVKQRRVYAIHLDQGCLRSAKFTVKGDYLYMHHLEAKSPPADAYTLEYRDVLSLSEKSSTLTFLELSAGGSTLGRLHVLLAPDTPRARNFALLCTGEKNHSYAHTSLLWARHKGQAMEGVWGGDYEMDDGEGGMALVRGLTTGGEYKRPWTAGTVEGLWWKGDAQGAQFLIYTRDNPGKICERAFGVVERGLGVLVRAINRYPDIKQVKVSDCGLVIHRSTSH
ncbi:hypothetical protein SK128_017964 [Halocaridina rubra]|uniref:RING-type domain-containing protein n=1 Tax=Halocaridina rubra TaxID=373956 RepID=A0AAN8WQB5_HALRR